MVPNQWQTMAADLDDLLEPNLVNPHQDAIWSPHSSEQIYQFELAQPN